MNSVEITNPNLMEDLNNIIMNDEKLNNKILTLAVLNGYNSIVCGILGILVFRIVIKSSIIVKIWEKLSPTEHPLLYKLFEANFFILVLQMVIVLYLIWEFDCIEEPY
jgi:hypothetical protein